MTDPTQRNPRPATDRPLMGDHPELETDDIPHAESDNDGGRSPLVIAGIVVLVLVVIVILLVVI